MALNLADHIVLNRTDRKRRIRVSDLRYVGLRLHDDNDYDGDIGRLTSNCSTDEIFVLRASSWLSAKILLEIDID